MDFRRRLDEPVVIPQDRRRWVLGTLAGAFFFRVALYFSGVVDVVFVTGDTPEYRALADSLLKHGVFGWDGVPKMNRTPGYPAFIALVWGTVGRSQAALTGVQMLLDAATCAMIVHVAIRAKMSRLGVGVAAVLSATCLYTATLSFQTMTETFYTFIVVLGLWVLPDGGATAFARSSSRWRVVVCGLLAGFATLIRPNSATTIMVFPLLMAFAMWRAVGTKTFTPKPIIAGLLFGVAAAAVVVPWMARNRTVFHEEFEKPDHSHVTLLGYKTDVATYRHWYTPQFHGYRVSQEDPFVMEKPFIAPSTARYVYPGEKEEVRAAFAVLTAEVIQKEMTLNTSTLDAFATITAKRYQAAPRLHVTPYFTRTIMLWTTPRAGVLFEGRHGGTIGKPIAGALVLYNIGYVIVGFAGLLLGIRQVGRARSVWMFALALVVAQTAFYVLWHGAPQSRYMIPLFPLLCLGAGLFAMNVRERGLKPSKWIPWLARRRAERSDAARGPAAD